MQRPHCLKDRAVLGCPQERPCHAIPPTLWIAGKKVKRKKGDAAKLQSFLALNFGGVDDDESE